MWATATHRVGALIVGVALVYATVAQGAFAADQAVVVFGLVGLAAVVALVGRRAVARPVVVAVGLLVALALWTAARAVGGPATRPCGPGCRSSRSPLRRWPSRGWPRGPAPC